MPYSNPYDPTKPAIADTRANVVANTRTNLAALHDMLLLGGDGTKAWAYSYTGGDATKPATIVAANGSERFRWTLTWSGNQCTQIVAEYDPSGSGTTYSTVGTFTFGWSGNTVISGNVGSFVLARLMHIIAYSKDVYDQYTTHAAATGTAVHGLGTMSTQTASAVAITGGTVNGASVGVTTPADGFFTRATEKYNPLSPTSNQTPITADWTYGGTYIPVNGTHANLTFSNVPAAGSNKISTHLIYVTNFNSITNWPAAVAWGSAGKPSIAGAAGIQLMTMDGGTTVIASVFYRAV